MHVWRTFYDVRRVCQSQDLCAESWSFVVGGAQKADEGDTKPHKRTLSIRSTDVSERRRTAAEIAIVLRSMAARVRSFPCRDYMLMERITRTRAQRTLCTVPKRDHQRA